MRMMRGLSGRPFGRGANAARQASVLQRRASMLCSRNRGPELEAEEDNAGGLRSTAADLTENRSC
jgi:hypothetical protein